MLGDVRESENRSEGGEYEEERDIVGVCTGEVHAPSPIDTYTGVVGSFHSLFFFVIYFRKQLFHPNYCIRRTKFVSAVVSFLP